MSTVGVSRARRRVLFVTKVDNTWCTNVLIPVVARICSPRAVKVIRAKSQRAEGIVPHAHWDNLFVTSVVDTSALSD